MEIRATRAGNAIRSNYWGRSNHEGSLRAGLGAGLVVGLAMGLGACGPTDQFLFDRSTPDEFAVVARAPLTVPPSHELRPPSPGSPRPADLEQARQTQATVFGGPADSGDGPGSGEQALLVTAGAVGTDPDIRRILEQETADYLDNREGLLDFLILWDEPPPGDVIDPAAERERLARAAATDAPVTGADVPIIERRREAPFEGIFN